MQAVSLLSKEVLDAKLLKELDEQIMKLRKSKSSLEDKLYNTDWKRDTDADPIIRKIDEINEQLDILRAKKKKITMRNYKGEIVPNLGAGAKQSSTSLKSIM